MPRRADISSILVIGAAILFSGCSAPHQANEGDLKSRLERIEAECGLISGAFKVLDSDQIQFRPDPNEDYDAVDCALQKAKKQNLISRMGFVGNEYIGPDQ